MLPSSLLVTTMSILLALSVSLLPLQPLQSDNFAVFNSVSALAYAENNSAYHLIKGNEVPYHEAESAFTQNEAALGVSYRNWSVALLYRYDWFLKFNHDAMAVYDALANDRLLESGRSYDVELEVSYFTGTGIRIAHFYPLNDSITLYGAVAYWQGDEFFDGRANGDIALGEDDNYTGNVDLSYRYTEDYIFDRNVSEPETDYGITADIGIDWRIAGSKVEEYWLLSFMVTDLYSKIRWADAPYTEAVLKTANTIIDPNGKVDVDPVMTGFEGNRNYNQSLPEKYQASISYQTGEHSLSLRGFWAYRSQLIDIGYQYRWNQLQLGLNYYTETDGIGVEIAYNGIYFVLISDDFDYQDASLFGVNLGYQIRF